MDRDRSPTTSVSLVLALALGAITGFLAARSGSAHAQVITQDWRECFLMPIATSSEAGSPEAVAGIPNRWSIVGTIGPAGVVLCR